MSNEINMSQVGFGAATRARIDANHAQQEADEERRRAMLAEAALRTSSTDKDLERKVRGLGLQNETLSNSVNYLQAQLAERDAMLAEWMHSTEAFRRLARQYGKKLGVTDEQRAEDYANHVADLAEEDPKFANTKLAKEAKPKKTVR